MSETILAYKGFGTNWKCRDFQFAVGESYTHDGEVKLCSSGFHACEYPLDVFNYYGPTGKLAIVEMIEPSQEKESDSKRVSKKIRIKSELSIFDLVSASIEYTTKNCNTEAGQHTTGYRSASSATGYQSASSATGDQSASSATGDQSASSATGKNSVAMNIGRFGKASAGKDGAIVLCNHDDDGNIRHIRASKVGENGIKPDCFYILNDSGEFEETK